MSARPFVDTNVLLYLLSVDAGKAARAEQVLADIQHFAEVHPLTLATHQRGLALAERYQLALYDALIAAAAIEAGCDTLCSEDFQTGQVLDGRLTIHNPFGDLQRS